MLFFMKITILSQLKSSLEKFRNNLANQLKLHVLKVTYHIKIILAMIRMGS